MMYFLIKTNDYRIILLTQIIIIIIIRIEWKRSDKK